MPPCEHSGLGHCARKHPVGWPKNLDTHLWGIAWVADEGCLHPFQYVLTEEEAVKHLGWNLTTRERPARRPVVMIRRDSASEPWEATL